MIITHEIVRPPRSFNVKCDGALRTLVDRCDDDTIIRKVTVLPPSSPAVHFAIDLDEGLLGTSNRYNYPVLSPGQILVVHLFANQTMQFAASSGIGSVGIVVEYFRGRVA